MISEILITKEECKQTFPTEMTIPYTAKEEDLPDHLKFIPRMDPNVKLTNGNTENFVPEKPMLWVHMETTGDDPEKDEILEISCSVTDGAIKNEIGGPGIVLTPKEEVWEQMEKNDPERFEKFN